jgi:thiamine-phosphate pyrophosphorylase
LNRFVLSYMNWKRELLKNFKLYAITDLTTGDSDILAKIRGALRGGADVIQLRSKSLSDQSLLRIGLKIRKVTEKLNKLFVVNDRVDIAIVLRADGVHLGQDDLPTDCARKMLGNQQIFIGRSTHSLTQAMRATREGADYIGFGPLFGTPTKPRYRPVGLNRIKQVLDRVRVPVVCIGGIDETNVQSVVDAGANRVAVVRAIFSSNDARRAASQLRGFLN